MPKSNATMTILALKQQNTELIEKVKDLTAKLAAREKNLTELFCRYIEVVGGFGDEDDFISPDNFDRHDYAMLTLIKERFARSKKSILANYDDKASSET